MKKGDPKSKSIAHQTESVETTSEQHEILRASFSGHNLNFPEDDLTEYDTYLQIYRKVKKEWVFQETTETVFNTSSPKYKKKVEMEYFFEDNTRF